MHIDEQKSSPCMNCGGWYKNETYAFERYGGYSLKVLCLDCWVIDYDEGKTERVLP